MIPILRIDDYGSRLIVTTLFTAIAWLFVLLFTPPEDEEVLDAFVRKVRPPGPGWSALRQRLGVTPVQPLSSLFVRFCLGSAVLFGGLFGSGGFLLHQEWIGWFGLVIAVISLSLLNRKNLFDISMAS